MRLFRTLIVLGAAGLFLPSPPEDPSATGEDTAGPSTFEVISSAGSAASDAWSFCSRQPEVCGVAAYLGGKLEAKALYSASLLWGWTFEDTPEPPAAHVQGPFAALTVSGPVPDPPGGPPQGQSTLQLDDLIAPWRRPLE
ncbi:hypothetical protein [Aestuariivirga sp.]|uniref:hypothetical protein n=1 Tax=Aestuariivirga sp. TaxID=2650926 RepID=UPI003BA866B2